MCSGLMDSSSKGTSSGQLHPARRAVEGRLKHMKLRGIQVPLQSSPHHRNVQVDRGGSDQEDQRADRIIDDTVGERSRRLQQLHHPK